MKRLFANYYPPCKQSLGVYRNHPVRPSVRLFVHVPCKRNSSGLNGLLDFYETLHICSTLPVDVHEGIWLLSKI
jgi:hypothetical protein